MLRVGVIDDEPRSLVDLARRLEATGLCEVVCRATDPVEGLALLQETAPELVLLDIEMPGLDGLALAAALPALTAVVFVSAHASHALAAFDVAAIDFVLKPVDDHRFCRMIERVRRRLRSVAGAEGPPENLLILETSRGRVLCPEAEILVVFAEGDMSRVLIRGDRQIFCLRSLKHFEQLLRVDRFVRLDRSTALNLDVVRNLRALPGGKAELILADSNLPVIVGRAAAGRLRSLLPGCQSARKIDPFAGSRSGPEPTELITEWRRVRP